MSLFPGTKLHHGSLEELYLSREPQVASGEPPHHLHKICKSISMVNVKPFKEEPRERSLSQDCWMTEASAAVVSYRLSSEHGSEVDLLPALQQGPVLCEVVSETDH